MGHVETERSTLPGTIPPAVLGFAALLVLTLGLGAWRAWLDGLDGPGPLRLAMATLLLAGVLTRHRLAWQWGRLLGFFFSASLVVLGVALATGDGALSIEGWGTSAPRWAALALPFALAAAGFAVAVALGRASSRRWFRLVCPTCESERTRAADFLFQRARCRSCGLEF